MNLRVAVVGTGHLGRIHASLIGQLESVELTAVVDPDAARCRQIANEFSTTPLRHHAELVGKVDAAIVAAPNFAHAEIGSELLANGIHVLMEKPLATSVNECDRLLNAATYGNRVLQVGHVERFNPAFKAAAASVENPKYIEARRTSGYPARSTDIGVVLDLMIHDIDLVLNLAQSEVCNVKAMGAAVLGGHEDMAQARLEFANGCIADLIASRVSFEASRKMNVYCRTGFASIDFQSRTAQAVQPNEHILNGSLIDQEWSAQHQAHLAAELYTSLLQQADLDVRESNAILEEQLDFVTAIQQGRAPIVTGEDGRQAVLVAEQILTSVDEHQWNGIPAGPVGPHAEPISPILKSQQWPVPSSTRKAG